MDKQVSAVAAIQKFVEAEVRQVLALFPPAPIEQHAIDVNLRQFGSVAL